MASTDPDSDAAPARRAGPLAGIRVVELATVVMGPYGTQLLADMGAEIIKVETEEGDSSRVMGGGPHPEFGGIALNLHRNKRSIGVNLKNPEGRDVFLRLVAGADVMVTNLRPGPLERLGLDYASVVGVNERLIYCQAQGFRTDSDEANKPAYDDIIQALTGYPQLNEMTSGTSRFFPSIIADKVAGMTIANGVLAALVERSVSGLGQRVEVPMFDAALAFNLVEHLSRGVVPGQPLGYSRVLTAHRGPHLTADGWVAMMPYSDREWAALFTEAGETHLLDTPPFVTLNARLLNANEVYAALAEVVRKRPTAEWIAICEKHSIPVSIVPTFEEIITDPAHNRGVVIEAEHPVIGTYRQTRAPVIFSRSGQAPVVPAPWRAQDTEAILAELGVPSEEVGRLIDSGAISVSKTNSTINSDTSCEPKEQS